MQLRRALFLTFVVATPVVGAEHKPLVDELVRPLVEEKFVVACVVGLVDHGKTEVYGYGVTRLGGDEQPDGDTIFEIGSMTKAFTGTLLADAVNRNVLRLDAKLQSFMPDGVRLQEVPGRPIRLVDVASQSSGLPRMPSNFAPRDPDNPYVDYSADDMFAFLRDYQLTRPPGEYEYSNLGMGLLGYLVSRAESKGFEQLLVDRICDPLEMDDTRIRLSKEQQGRLALPYNGESSPVKNWELDALAGAGAIRSTANDILKFLKASLDGEPRTVSAAIHLAWQQRHGPPPSQSASDTSTMWSHGIPKENRVGLGWQIAPDGVTRWHHGQTGGYSSVMYVHPPTQQAVVVLCNTPTDLIWPMGEQLLQRMRGLRPPAFDVPRTVDVERELLRRCVGEYQLAPSEQLTVTLDEEGLAIQLTGQNEHRLYPRSATEFFLKIVDAQVTFVAGKDGEIGELVLHQNGFDQAAPRLPDSTLERQ